MVINTQARNDSKRKLQFDGTARDLRPSGRGWEEVMLSVHIENIGDMAVVDCENSAECADAKTRDYGVGWRWLLWRSARSGTKIISGIDPEPRSFASHKSVSGRH